MRVAIVDDEPLARRGISQLLADHPDIEIVAEFSNGAEGLGAIEAQKPDLVFLDVQMPEMDGFELIRRVGAERMPAVVFVAAYDEFAIRAFEASAVDYLMKPVGPERFATTMRRVNERMTAAAAVGRLVELQALLTQIAPTTAPLIVTTARGVLRFDPNEIDWIRADDYYAVLHVGPKHYLLRESLASLESRLPNQAFIRVHRSTIVNRNRVCELRHGVLILRDGTRVNTSRRRRAAVNLALRAVTVR